jgi:hypothetical protein
MFDRSLEKSELYFAVLQILRIISDWIQESVTDLENQEESRGCFQRLGHGMAEHLSEEGRERDREVINSNWDLLALHHATLAKALLERIQKKTTEVESLRDGVISNPIAFTLMCSDAKLTQLFNATQVREATRATRISQYIFVFTVMTIFYLPLSFVAVCISSSLSKASADSRWK